MGVMPKNLADPIEHTAPIVALAQSLENPADYYHGRPHDATDLPDHILLFHRRSADSLVSARSRHFHHRYVLVVPLRGSGRLVLNGRAFTLRPGRCALIAPYQFHQFSGFHELEPEWLFITYMISRNPLNGTIFHPISEDFWTDVRCLLQDFLAAGKGSRLAFRLALILGNLAVTNPTRSETRSAASGTEDLLLRVHGMIAAHMDRLLSIEEIGAQLGLSASHLRAKFRAATGKSLGEFQREVRLQRAAELVVQNGATVAEAAEACGWECPSAFSRAFTRYWGRPPKRFAQFTKRG